jgi:hypothetical protein
MLDGMADERDQSGVGVDLHRKGSVRFDKE